MNSLGERIAYYRKKINLTQEQLAEKCSVTPQAVSKWENDLTSPDITLLPAMAELFGITCDELLGARKTETAAIAPELVDFNKALLKIRVVDGKDMVKVNLPLAIAEIALKSGMINFSDGKASDALKGIDFARIISLVKMGAIGKLVEVQGEGGETVEIWVE